MNGALGNHSGPIQGICPDGWHLPTRTEFETLLTNVGNDADALLDSSSNTSGFSAYYSGFRRFDCRYSPLSGNGYYMNLLTATIYNNSICYYFFISSGHPGVTDLENNDRCTTMRCIQGDGETGFPSIDGAGFTNDNRLTTSYKIIDNGSTGHDSVGLVVSQNENPYDDDLTYENNSYRFPFTNLTLDTWITVNADLSHLSSGIYKARVYVHNAKGYSYGSIFTFTKP